MVFPSISKYLDINYNCENHQSSLLEYWESISSNYIKSLEVIVFSNLSLMNLKREYATFPYSGKLDVGKWNFSLKLCKYALRSFLY